MINRAPAREVMAPGDAQEVVLQEHSLISVVDDDQSFRDSMRRLLKSLGYPVEMFPSAGAFLASPDLERTACLVADVHMPEMTGTELYTHLVDLGHTIPTILVTAYPDYNVRKRMLGMGVACYLSKPLEESALIGCVRSAVARRNASGESG